MPILEVQLRSSITIYSGPACVIAVLQQTSRELGMIFLRDWWEVLLNNGIFGPLSIRGLISSRH